MNIKNRIKILKKRISPTTGGVWVYPDGTRVADGKNHSLCDVIDEALEGGPAPIAYEPDPDGFYTALVKSLFGGDDIGKETP